MCLSDNIKRLRLERKMTQEQLAAMLGVTAQAVSKWETTETYPDGALLMPLAQALHVSLDTLFGNDFASMADLCERIEGLIHNTEESERFAVGREIGWLIERALADCYIKLFPYSHDEFQNYTSSSYILNDYGFTVISNGKEPFFSIFPEPEDGFGDFLNDREDLQRLFAILSHPLTLNALLFLYHKPQNYLLDRETLAKNAELPEDGIDETLENLFFLRAIEKQELILNGEPRTLYCSKVSHKLFALLLFAKEVRYYGPHCVTGNRRTKPFLEKKDIQRNKNDEANAR